MCDFFLSLKLNLSMSSSNNYIKTGSYAVTTVYSMPWSKKKPTETKTKRKRVEKKIMHPIFEECAELTDDNYWVRTLYDCARGKFPRGFYFKNGLLTHRRGNKMKRVQVPNSPHEALSVTLSFFKTSAGMMSSRDRKRIQKEEEEKMVNSMNNHLITWKDIKTDKIKDILISEYVTEISKNLNYTKDQKKELITTIRCGFMLKYFGSNDINMKDGKIVSINGFLYDKSENMYYIDPNIINKSKKKTTTGLGLDPIIPKTTSFISSWEKYLISLQKKNHGQSQNFRINESNKSSNSGELYSSGDTPNDTDNSYTPGSI